MGRLTRRALLTAAAPGALALAAPWPARAKWNDPKGHPWTIGWQPNYQSEGRIYAAFILANKPDGKIGVLYNNDDAGKKQVQMARFDGERWKLFGSILTGAVG